MMEFQIRMSELSEAQNELQLQIYAACEILKTHGFDCEVVMTHVSSERDSPAYIAFNLPH